jgi:hypothetical protein
VAIQSIEIANFILCRLKRTGKGLTQMDAGGWRDTCAYRKCRRPAGFGSKSVGRRWGRLAGTRGALIAFLRGGKWEYGKRLFLPGADAPCARHGARLCHAPVPAYATRM